MEISPLMRKVLAIIVLFLLLAVPFFNWRAGAALWLGAWTVYFLKGLYAGRPAPEGDEEQEKEKKGG